MAEKNPKGVRLNDCDPAFKFQVAAEPGGEGITACFACAACSARCPLAEHAAGFDPRRLIRLTLLGRRQEVLSAPELWICASCYACQETCPQQVRFTEVVTAIRNLAARQGQRPPSAEAILRLLARHGRLLEVDEFANDRRREMGLPLVKEHSEPFRQILGITGDELDPKSAEK